MTDARDHGRGHDRRYVSAAERLRAPRAYGPPGGSRVSSTSASRGSPRRESWTWAPGTGVFAEAFAWHGTGGHGNRSQPRTARRRTAPRAGRRVSSRATAEKLPFEDHSFDLVMMGHVLHETDDRAAALSEARRVARQRVAILEWPYLEEDQGPPLAHRLQESEILSLARDAGFARIEKMVLTHMHLYRLTP